MANGQRVAILATHGFEQSELLEPRRRLQEAGFEVEVISPETGEIRGWKDKDWGDTVVVDRVLSEADADDYAALVLPGGVINPDNLRTDKAAVAFVQAFDRAGKPLAAICHGPWLLAEAGVASSRALTSYQSIRTDMVNAGGNWRDEEVVTDGHLITSRKPDDIPAFSEAVIQALREAGKGQGGQAGASP